jgi:tubulin beta
MREIINLQVGQCGNNVGLKFVQKILEEHGIDNDGNYTGTNDYQRQRIDVFFA